MTCHRTYDSKGKCVMISCDYETTIPVKLSILVYLIDRGIDDLKVNYNVKNIKKIIKLLKKVCIYIRKYSKEQQIKKSDKIFDDLVMVEAFCETEELIGLQDLIQFNDLSMKVLSKINKQVKKK